MAEKGAVSPRARSGCSGGTGEEEKEGVYWGGSEKEYVRQGGNDREEKQDLVPRIEIKGTPYLIVPQNHHL